MDARYSSRYCVTVFPVIFRKRRQQTSRDRCTCSPSFSSEITDSYHYSDAFLTIEAPFYFLLGLLAVYRTSIQSMQNGRAPFAACMIELVMRLAATVWLSRFLGYTAVCIASPLAWFGAVALLIPVYYRMMMKPVKTVQSNLVHRILICLATQNPESFRSSSEVLKRFRVFYFAVFSSQIVSRFFPSIQIQRYTRFICSSSSASRSVFTITWPIRSVPSAMAETTCPSG